MAKKNKTVPINEHKEQQPVQGYITHDEDDDWMSQRIQTIADVNAAMDEYKNCGDSIPELLRAILRELVWQRIREESNGRK